MAQRCLNVVVLPMLGAAAHQNDKHLAVRAEIGSIARAAINPQSRGAFAKRLRVRNVPSPSLSMAIVTQAAARSSRASNQRLKGLTSSSVMNSSTWMIWCHLCYQTASGSNLRLQRGRIGAEGVIRR